MDRVVVVGCGGSGKTHLARRLGAALNVKVVHLDSVYYDGDWNPLPQDEFAALQLKLVASRGWVIEGNYASTLPIRLAAADTVIFIDLPPWTCLWGLLQRRLRHGRGQHGAIGVYDRITWGFIRYIWTYRRDMRPRVLRLIDELRPGPSPPGRLSWPLAHSSRPQCRPSPLTSTRVSRSCIPPTTATPTSFPTALS